MITSHYSEQMIINDSGSLTYDVATEYHILAFHCSFIAVFTQSPTARSMLENAVFMPTSFFKLKEEVTANN